MDDEGGVLVGGGLCGDGDFSLERDEVCRCSFVLCGGVAFTDDAALGVDDAEGEGGFKISASSGHASDEQCLVD